MVAMTRIPPSPPLSYLSPRACRSSQLLISLPHSPPQSVPVVVSAMLKAATESSVLSNELNPAALMELADQTDAQRVEDKWDKEPFMPLTAVGHSMAVLRARELRRWAGGAEFREMFRDVKAKVFFLSEEGW